MGKVVEHIQCPECGSRSGGKIYDNGSFYCHSCNKSKKSLEGSVNYKQDKPRGPFFTPEEIQSFPIADLSHRGIRKEFTEMYGVRQSVSEMNGEPDKHIFFPSGHKGKGWKRKNKLLKDDMSIYGKYSGLFGQHLAGNGKMLIITEGEEDCLAVKQMLTDYGKPLWKVVSLPNGANQDGRIDKATLEEYDWLKSFEKLVLCFDSDKNGKATVEGFADVFAGQSEIRVIELPLKDANEMLKEGKEKEFIRAFYDAKEYRPEKMEQGSDVAFEDVHKAMPKGVYVPTFPKLMDRMRGLRPEEMTMILAPSGVGKSTFCRELVYELLKQGKSVANIFLEEKTTKTRQGLIALDNNVPLWKYRENPNLIPKEQARKTYDDLIASGRCHFVRHRGSLSDSSLLSLIKWYRAVEGVDFVVLDHISMVLSGRRSNNERVEIDGLLTDMAAVVEETGVHLIVVSHIRRMLNKIYVKDEENDAEWLFIDLDAARGSGAFEQLSWNILTLEPEKTEVGERGRTRINIRKNREIGAIGPCDILKMDAVTGRMVTVEPMETEF